MSREKEPGLISTIFFAGQPALLCWISALIGGVIWILQQITHFAVWVWHVWIAPNDTVALSLLAIVLLMNGLRRRGPRKPHPTRRKASR